MYTTLLVMATLLYISIFVTTIVKWGSIFIHLRKRKGLDAFADFCIFLLLAMISYSLPLVWFSGTIVTTSSISILTIVALMSLEAKISTNSPKKHKRSNRHSNAYLKPPLKAFFEEKPMPVHKIQTFEKKAKKMWDAYQRDKKTQAQFWADYEKTLKVVKELKV
ncbi:hypothetical protein [Microscilla marina]|uniref:Uncharacterized protein n=1 Tax=Microscilla marina ATCC 23134 TaxID=313606 RepID=A1ZH90_MICM2|nr:hypothetical protein [Microscilla marina]EAY30359.1 hypothetical protein M23134_08188 [Microscilla marina ATCC 23134]